MSFFPGDSRLFGPLFSDTRIAGVFSDEAYLRRLVEVEVALARVQGELGVIPRAAADAIAARAPSLQPDVARLTEATRRDGFPVIGLLAQLREHLGGEAAEFVHWGATTQDVIDTALVLQLREVLTLIEGDIERLVAQLAALAELHRDTLIAGRTHSQHALPTTFGLKAATWLVPLVRHLDRLRELRPRLLLVQLGGAAGTLASLGERGLDVQRALAAELGLGVPVLPWHTQRDSLAELAGWLSLVTGSLGKVGQDVILMAQSEVAELSESADRSRGASSTMPQKSNPIQSELLVAAARQNAGLLSGMHHALVQEHERATHGWQLEWLSLPQMVSLTGGALQGALKVTGELQVNADRMRANVEASHGVMLAEAATLLLVQYLPHAEAKTVVHHALAVAAETGRNLIDVLRASVDVHVDWESIGDETKYLGLAGIMTDAVLRELHDR
jgi:3-carboxy-cis,cis-muconate cycloisomerase